MRPGPSPALDPGWLHEIDGQPAIAFLARYLDVTGPASYGNPLAVIEAGGDESYLRAIGETDPASGSVFVAGTIPVGAVVQLTTADTEEILAGAGAALRRATAEFPAGARPEAALIFSCAVRRFLLGSRTGVEADLARTVLGPSMPIAGMYCFGEIGPVRGDSLQPLLQRDVHDPPPRHVTDEPTIDAEPRVDDLRKENARLTRRVARVEATLREVEQIRDTNARLLDRIRDELDVERRRSHDLLLNVLPQAIIDRLGAGEGLIADRHEDVAVIFSDFVGFTEISSRLPVATVVSALNAHVLGLRRVLRGARGREDQDDRRRLHGGGRAPRDAPAITSARRRTWRSRCRRRSRPRATRGRSGSASTAARSWPA